MAKPTAQQCHALTTYFVSAVEKATGKKPVVNRNRVRWGFESLLMDYTTTEAKALIDFYLRRYESPNIDWFLYNYDQVVRAVEEREEEEAKRARRRAETQKRLEEWKEKFEKE